MQKHVIVLAFQDILAIEFAAAMGKQGHTVTFDTELPYSVFDGMLMHRDSEASLKFHRMWRNHFKLD